MDRPTVVLNAVCSIDGRIALTDEQPLMFEPSASVWGSLVDGAPDVMGEIRRRHRPGAVLNGSGSFVGGDDSAFTGSPGAATDWLRADAVTRPPREWFVVADSRGRIRWSFVGDEQAELLVLVARSTPASYLTFLRDNGISHLVAGDERVDPSRALSQLRDALGIRCVVVDGGGELNASFVRAGLVDELYVTILPAMIGGRDTPSMFDGPPLALGESPVRLRLASTREENGFVTLHYTVG